MVSLMPDLIDHPPHSLAATGSVPEHWRTYEAAMELDGSPLGWLSTSPCPAILFDSSGAIVAVNRRAEILFESEEKVLLGKDVAVFFGSCESAGLTPQCRRDALRDSGSWTGRRVLRGQNGDTTALLCSACLLRSGTTASEFVLEVFQEISATVPEDLQVEKLAAFPHWNPNPVLEFSPQGTLTYSNRAAVDLAASMGWSSVRDILPTSSNEIIAECLQTGKPRLRLELPHGERVISWSFFPILPLNVVHCYAGEVTERHRLELQFRQSQKLESLGRLAGGVAHDFNNLLTVIRGQASLVASGHVAPDAIAEALDQIQLAAERGSRLTRQLLTFSRQQVVEFGNSDLNAVIRHVQKLLSRVVGEHIQIQLRATDPLPAVWCDPSMIEQVLMNLAVNSRDAMPSGGQVMIETDVVEIGADYVETNPDAHLGRTVCLSFRDTGTGIAPVHLPRIFEPFFTTKEVGAGTGLGLATVYGIVKQHRGWIRVVSEAGRGTTFQIHFPESPGGTVEKAIPRESSPLPAGRGETVLVVEDEPPVRSLIVSALRHQGYTVHEASSGAAALQLWEKFQGQIDLLLTDIVMPGGINGRELAIRFSQAKPGLKVLLITGYSADVMNETLLKKNNFSLLPKPFDFEELAKGVRHALTTPPNRLVQPG